MRPLRALTALACVALGGESLGAEKVSATKLSSNATWSIRMRVQDGAKCTVEVLQESEVRWALDACVGNADDLYFVSNSGERFWVLYTLPEEPNAPKKPTLRPSKKKQRPEALFIDVPVAREYDRTGKVLATRTVRDLVGPYGRNKVQQLGRHFKWLGGVNGVKGKAAHTNEHDQVELDTVEPKIHQLDF